MNKGGTVEVAGLRVTMVRADHSAGDWNASDETTLYLGEPAGFVVELENGFRIYHAGDTAVFGDMALIRDLFRPDLAMLPIGGHFTMDPAGAALAAELLGVRHVLPIHWGTFPILAGTPAPAARRDRRPRRHGRGHRLEAGRHGRLTSSRSVAKPRGWARSFRPRQRPSTALLDRGDRRARQLPRRADQLFFVSQWRPIVHPDVAEDGGPEQRLAVAGRERQHPAHLVTQHRWAAPATWHGRTFALSVGSTLSMS